ncbi:hypothetical protein ACJRO7_018509 [Eucalyptus globulus]|uniref:CAF17 C-terminal domain-containing protein n=1 Tax=Eucalyptus globulus TaxID=34317 RepID=A0ABD3L0K6_EUCGL
MPSGLRARSVIQFSGPGTIKFLQGLLSNDVQRFGETPSEKTLNPATPNMPVITFPSMYAALLIPQGRFYKLKKTGSGPGSNDGELEPLADVGAQVLDEVVQTLKRYRLRAKVDIGNISKDFTYWQRYDTNYSHKSKSSTAKEPDAASVGWGAGIDKSASQGNDIRWQWFKDPRLDSLGYRGIFPSSSERKGFAEGSIEIPKGEAIPLEYNLEGLNMISMIRKRLLPLKFLHDNRKEAEQKVSSGLEILDAASGRRIGIVTSILGCRGLGLLQLEDAPKKSSLLAKLGQDLNVEAVKPDWWPPEWF